MNKTFWQIGGVVTLAISLNGCSIFKSSNADSTSGWSANKIYQKAKIALHEGDYQKSIDLYESLEARYPLGRYAQQAQLETAYAYYRYQEEDNALDSIDRFLRINPQSPNVPYALYLRGLVNFNRGHSFLDKFFPRNIADLDNVRQKEAFHDFSRVIARYPSSKYAPDANMRIQHLRNALAVSEANVADYYLKRGAWLAAFNRAEYTIKHYQGAPAVLTALRIKIKAAQALGKDDLANDAKRVLQINTTRL